ncbi:Hypothetical predicted protein [Mytilus galloprovincialis]|uniref:Fucolectin tachylectin-4 pentraxin-1 domain-containing protein n=1 Tax=Mytilus galloprovincialis TaxID=29158 RepID=A0A8B6CE74_MYTGA|nr:Hypothetical predicted protein [Mytilus galloprovincialis]
MYNNNARSYVLFFLSVNLAPQGVAVQRTTFTVFNASLAIEGPANNVWTDGCSATAKNQTYAWWGLQLPAVAHMATILIYYRQSTPERMAGFRLYLENGTADQSSTLGECYSDEGKDSLRSITRSITCNMLAQNMYFVNNRTIVDCFVELCYVAIYGCWKATWGTNCRESCPVNCINQNCYPKTGLCVWGCDPRNCSNNKCDIQTGVCTDGCVIGQAGQYCDMPCDPGFFGNNCSRKCSKNCFNPYCHHVTGDCIGGCKKGWDEFNCTKGLVLQRDFHRIKY